MARNPEYYKGRRQRRNYWLIPFILLVALLTLLVVLFYGMQKYAKITDEGVQVVLPGMAEEAGSQTDARTQTATDGQIFDTIVPEILFESPDYSRIEAVAGKRVRPVRAIFLEASELSVERIQAAAGSLIDGNALMLEMKPRSGQLMWASTASLAVSYGMAADNEFSAQLPELIQSLKATESGKEIYLVAQISCFIDEMLATRSTQFALRTATGFNYMDENGVWLDPYNADVRNYIVTLARELYDLGFDEVVLADVMHPVVDAVQNPDGTFEKPQFMYSHEMSTEPNPITAICGFAVYAATELAERPGLLSIYTDSARSLVRDDENSGQNAVLFLKLYDRVYYRTDRYTYTFNLQDMEGSVRYGDVHDRFVPVVINLIPHDNSSWIYIERLAEEQQ
ncbi:MAG: hypothetical protein J5949_05220 [Oscillospiraceae bacterium]|nr:hypothetical protein [Oscillospiraceae bacterium]